MKNSIIVILIIGIIGLIIWDSFFRKFPESNPITQYSYITDSIYVDKPYSVPVPYSVNVPPKIVKIYQVDSSIIDSFKIIIHEKDVTITTLKESMLISNTYLGGYLGNPKLLGLRLTNDSIALGLLEISGQIVENSYPVNNQKYEYNWTFDKDMTMRPLTLDKPKQKITLNTYVGGGFDFLYKSPFISAKIESEFSRIRLYGNAELGLLSNETNGIKIGVDYKFNAKNTTRIR